MQNRQLLNMFLTCQLPLALGTRNVVVFVSGSDMLGEVAAYQSEILLADEALVNLSYQQKMCISLWRGTIISEET